MVEECSSQLTGFDEGFEGIDGPEFNILYNDQGTEGNIIYIISGSTITLFNEYTGLAEGVIDRKSSSVINTINDDACLVIGNVVRLSGGSIEGLEGINGGTGTLIWDEGEESGPVGFIEEDPNLLLPGIRAVNSFAADAYGIVVGGDFDGIYKDGTLNSNDLAKGFAVAFKGDGVRICTQGRCLAIADGALTGEINVGDDLIASANGLVKAFPGGPIIARALQSATKINSIIAVDVQRIAGLGSVWAFKKQLTVDFMDVTGASTLTDFPLLVSITDSDLRDNAKADGSDIYFTKANGTTRVPFERASYDSSTGTLIAWVLTDLSDTGDTNLFMFYGNPTSADQEDAAPVWAARSFFDVFHFNQTSFPWLNSGTESDFDIDEGSVISTALSGQVGTSASINISNIKFKQSTSPAIDSNDFFFSCWIKYDIIGTNEDDWTIFISAPPVLGITNINIEDGANSGSPKMVFRINDSFNIAFPIFGDMTDLSFHHIAARYTDSSNTLDQFFDGDLVESTSSSPSEAFRLNPSQCGGGSVATTNVNGRIDEIQFADNSNFSDGFVKTSYDNQTMQGAGNFVKVGPQQSTT